MNTKIDVKTKEEAGFMLLCLRRVSPLTSLSELVTLTELFHAEASQQEFLRMANIKIRREYEMFHAFLAKCLGQPTLPL